MEVNLIPPPPPPPSTRHNCHHPCRSQITCLNLRILKDSGKRGTFVPPWHPILSMPLSCMCAQGTVDTHTEMVGESIWTDREEKPRQIINGRQVTSCRKVIWFACGFLYVFVWWVNLRKKRGDEEKRKRMKAGGDASTHKRRTRVPCGNFLEPQVTMWYFFSKMPQILVFLQVVPRRYAIGML
jgi:hypothetical protein